MQPALPTVAAVFARHPVVCAYLFGSRATDETWALSDVDVAVLLSPGVESRGLLRATLISDLMLALDRSDVDVVVLDDAPPLLKERVISRGRVIYCRDEAARVRFEVAARREYFDTRRLRAAQDEALLERYTGTR
jgi:predicted nucleotidyltransferase